MSAYGRWYRGAAELGCHPRKIEVFITRSLRPMLPGGSREAIGRDGVVPGDASAAGAWVEPELEQRTCPRHPAGETPGQRSARSPSPPSTLKYANSNAGGFLHTVRAALGRNSGTLNGLAGRGELHFTFSFPATSIHEA